MARYSALLGRRIEVHYHAGETVLPDEERASGKRGGINTVRYGVSTVSTPK